MQLQLVVWLKIISLAITDSHSTLNVNHLQELHKSLTGISPDKHFHWDSERYADVAAGGGPGSSTRVRLYADRLVKWLDERLAKGGHILMVDETGGARAGLAACVYMLWKCKASITVNMVKQRVRRCRPAAMPRQEYGEFLAVLQADYKRWTYELLTPMERHVKEEARVKERQGKAVGDSGLLGCCTCNC